MKKLLHAIIICMACVGISQAGEENEKMEKMSQDLKEATFAGGCFWCMEKPFEQYQGVLKVVSGYTGGEQESPSYNQVSSGGTGHLEAVQITYDSSHISYDKLLDIFWRQIDPTDSGGQFADRGTQYTTAIFYHDEDQKKKAQKSKEKLNASKRFAKPIVTGIIPFN